MKKTIILLAVNGAGITIGWLVMVGTIWVFQSLVNAVFGTEYWLNIWLGGLLAYIIWYIFKKK